MRVYEKNVAVMVVSFDGYADVWDTFAECINKYWKDRVYNTYLITNNMLPNYEDIKVIKTGEEVSWSARMRTALQYIKEEYIILLLEDYLVDKVVDNDAVKEAVEFAKEKGTDYLRIAPIPKLRGASGYATIIDKMQLYGVNLQASIWKKEYLRKLLGNDNFSAWEFEARQKFGSDERIDGMCYASNRYVIHYLNGIIQGKWNIKTLEQLKNIGISVHTGNRNVMKKSELIREDIRNFFSHAIPPQIIRMIKPVAKKMGLKFVTE